MTDAPVEERPQPQTALPMRGLFDGRWRVITRIGYGAFGQVYKAKDAESQEFVAVKLFNPQLDANGYIQELGLLFSESHPNIVKTISFGYSKTGRYIIYEYIAGGSLRDYLIRFPRIAPQQALGMLVQITSGLVFAHEHRVVHRDLKPENILLTRDTWPFEIKLCDFGLSTRFRAQTRMTSRYGSPGYMAPEQFEGDYDHRVDLYALGVILYEMLFGRRPFTGDYVSIRHAHKHREIPFPSQAPEALLSLLKRMLAIEPEARHPDARALLDDLLSTLRDLEHRDTEPNLSEPSFEEPTLKRAWRVELDDVVKQVATTRGGHLLLSTPTHIWTVLRDGRAKRLVQTKQSVDDWIERGSLKNKRIGWVSQGRIWLMEGSALRQLPSYELDPDAPWRLTFLPDAQAILVVTRSHVDMVELNGTIRWRAEVASYGTLPVICPSTDGKIVWIAQESPRTHLVALSEEGAQLCRTPVGGNEVKLVSANRPDRILVGMRGQPQVIELSAEGFITRETTLWEPLLDLIELSGPRALAISARHIQLIDTEALRPITLEPHPNPSTFTIHGSRGLYLLAQQPTSTSLEHFAYSPPQESRS